MSGYACSPDQRLTLICGTIVDFEGGERIGGYAVVDGDRLLAHGTVERPREGKVADAARSSSTTGSITASYATASWPIVPMASSESRSIPTLICSATACRKTAATRSSTASAPGSPDHCITAAFDVAAGRALARWRAECGTARAFVFDSDKQTVDLLAHDGDREAYDLITGEMHDRAGCLARRIACGDLRRTKSDLDADEVARIRAGLASNQANGEGCRLEA